MRKTFDLMFSTRTGNLAMRSCAPAVLLVLVVLAGEMLPQVIVSVLATALLIIALTFKNEISQHRSSIVTRACDLLPVAQSTTALAFALTPLPVRFYAAPARAKPRPAATRIGRLPAVTLSPRLLPVPTASA